MIDKTESKNINNALGIIRAIADTVRLNVVENHYEAGDNLDELHRQMQQIITQIDRLNELLSERKL